MAQKQNKPIVEIQSNNQISSNVVEISNLLETNTLSGKYGFIIWAAIEEGEPNKIDIGIGGDLQEHGLEAEKLADVIKETLKEIILQKTTIKVVDQGK